jgi:hypothetical protein
MMSKSPDLFAALFGDSRNPLEKNRGVNMAPCKGRTVGEVAPLTGVGGHDFVFPFEGETGR